MLRRQRNHTDSLLINSLTHSAVGSDPHSTCTPPINIRNPHWESIDVGTIGSKPPDVVASPAISQLRNVIADTPQDRENEANRWPLDAKAANKASFSFDE
jgi:hypothetical protein